MIIYDSSIDYTAVDGPPRRHHGSAERPDGAPASARGPEVGVRGATGAGTRDADEHADELTRGRDRTDTVTEPHVLNIL